ncbi:MAG: YraN family protein [Bacteroidales bacterium]|nr:YraN family protein [Bacteroidales bacterium]MBN2698773.1 YraN family protein [Bacteroidales bacterium]
MSHTVDLGRQAERLAEAFLLSKGYRVIRTNWRCGKKEIDIICIHEGTLVIVEVKSRIQSIHPVAGEVVDLKKQRNIIFATEAFLLKYNITLPTRFDIVSVVFFDSEFDVEHIENAFFPEVE